MNARKDETKECPFENGNQITVTEFDLDEKHNDVYLGRYDLELNEAGEFTLPEEWRSLAGASRKVWCVLDFHESCLNLVPWVAMMEEFAALRETATTDPEARKMLTRISERGCEIDVGASGGIVLPESLRQAIGMKGEVSLIGAFKTIKIWPRSALPLAETISEDDFTRALEDERKDG